MLASRCVRSLIRSNCTMSPVVTQTQGSAGIATLNRPKVLNSLDIPMINILSPQLRAWEEDSAVKTIILRGEGQKAFCAGGDVVTVAKAGKDDVHAGLDFFTREYHLDYQIATLKKPFVALIDGIVMGGGVGMSVHGKYRVATERTLFAMPETQIGLIPDVGGAYFLPKLKDGLGMYLALTGSRLKGGDVLHAGIATHYVPSEKIDQLTDALAVTDNVEQTLNEFSREAGSSSLAEVTSKIEACFTAPSVAAVMANLEREGSEWATKQLAALRRMSPVSLVVTFEQLRRGTSLSLAECLQMEFGLIHQCLLEPDFYEGIRAQLIDKDRNPKWSVQAIEDVDTAGVIDRYFNPANHVNFRIPA